MASEGMDAPAQTPLVAPLTSTSQQRAFVSAGPLLWNWQRATIGAHFLPGSIKSSSSNPRLHKSFPFFYFLGPIALGVPLVVGRLRELTHLIYVHHVFTICSPHVHYMFTTCSPYVFHMFTTCFSPEIEYPLRLDLRIKHRMLLLLKYDAVLMNNVCSERYTAHLPHISSRTLLGPRTKIICKV